MSPKIDFTLATSNQIEAALCRHLEQIRLSRNITQSQLAEEAGISKRTVGRLEGGKGVSLDTFVRVMMALGLQQNLSVLLPDPSVRPIERVGAGNRERQRASPVTSDEDRVGWNWGDEEHEDG